MPNSKSDPSAADLVCPHCGDNVRPVPLAFDYPSDDDPEWTCPGCGGGLWTVNGPGLSERLSGAVWGHLVGDAIGVPYEGSAPLRAMDIEFRGGGAHGQPPGTWSDDGALMLALLDSLLEAGFDTADQGRRALAWTREGTYTPDGDGPFDIGGATGRALAALERGVPAEDAGPTDEQSCGNGSLMRILPLALVERRLAVDVLVDRAHRASRVTHGHPRPQVACALYVLVARGLLEARLSPTLAMGEALITLRHVYGTNRFSPEHRASLVHLENWSKRNGRGRVWDSFWSAWDAFAGAESYEDAIRRAIGYGNDTDTTAAIAGGLAGLHWGIGAIPEEWLAGMRGRDIVEPLVARLEASGRLADNQ